MNLLGLLGIMFLAQLSPGPDMVLIIRTVISKGKKRAFGVVTGIVLGLSIHLILVSLGLSSIFSIEGSRFLFWVKVVGGFYITYLGVDGFLFNEKESSQDVKELGESGVLEGLLCNVLNPKVTVFVLGLFTLLVNDGATVSTLLIYSLAILIQSALIWFLLVVVLEKEIIRKRLLIVEKQLATVLSLILIILGALSLVGSYTEI